MKAAVVWSAALPLASVASDLLPALGQASGAGVVVTCAFAGARWLVKASKEASVTAAESATFARAERDEARSEAAELRVLLAQTRIELAAVRVSHNDLEIENAQLRAATDRKK